MIRIVLVFFGGGLGSLTRYLLANLIPCDIFPLSILLINALASFIRYCPKIVCKKEGSHISVLIAKKEPPYENLTILERSNLRNFN